jgi:hypothetical protein
VRPRMMIYVIVNQRGPYRSGIDYFYDSYSSLIERKSFFQIRKVWRIFFVKRELVISNYYLLSLNEEMFTKGRSNRTNSLNN